MRLPMMNDWFLRPKTNWFFSQFLLFSHSLCSGLEDDRNLDIKSQSPRKVQKAVYWRSYNTGIQTVISKCLTFDLWVISYHKRNLRCSESNRLLACLTHLSFSSRVNDVEWIFINLSLAGPCPGCILDDINVFLGFSLSVKLKLSSALCSMEVMDFKLRLSKVSVDFWESLFGLLSMSLLQ